MHCRAAEATKMDLTVWIPVMFVLGLVVLALMVAFTAVCAKV
jgi:hypothetical protein